MEDSFGVKPWKILIFQEKKYHSVLDDGTLKIVIRTKTGNLFLSGLDVNKKRTVKGPPIESLLQRQTK